MDYLALIDARTFLIVATLLAVLCAFVLTVQALSFPKDIHGLHDWAGGVVLIGMASGLAAMRSHLPDWATVIAASALLLSGQILLVSGLRRYCELSWSLRPLLRGAALVMLLMLWLTLVTSSAPGRIFIMSIAHTVLFGLGAWLSWQARPAGFGRLFLCAVFGSSAAASLWRLATVSVGATDIDEIFDHSLVQQTYLATLSLGVLGLSMGFVVLANERLREELQFLATRDPMTGALNRRAFFQRASIDWSRMLRSGRSLSVITSDIDFFKKVNDTYGHHIGDLVIKDYAHRAEKMLRLSDYLARFGGEEFVILLPDTSLTETRAVAERIRTEIAVQRDTALPAYTVSLGVADADGASGSAADIEALIAKADAALYRAKQGGRNRVECEGRK